MGLFVQAFLFDVNSRGYNMYIGGAGGMTAGKKDRFFELTLGRAYFYWPNSEHQYVNN